MKRFLTLLLCLLLPAAALAEEIAPATTLEQIAALPVFQGCGAYLFDREYRSNRMGLTLEQLQRRYAYLDAASSAQTLNEMARRVEAGSLRWLPLTEQTGLFYFAGPENAPFALICPGGGFEYVSALTEGFPLALYLNDRGCAAFVLHYRTGQGEQAACQDLAAALSYVTERAAELGVSPAGYSLWGASAGAWMAAYAGDHPPTGVPAPAAVVLQYGQYGDFTPDSPPACACAGALDTVVDFTLTQARLKSMAALGIPTRITVYPGVSHGFGLGENTPAAGWAREALDFWQAQRAGR